MSDYYKVDPRKITLRELVFREVCDGAPALLDWLCAKGAAGFKYDILASPFMGEGGQE